MTLRDPWLGAIVVVSLTLKMMLALSVEPLSPRNDENDYLRHARQIVEQHHYPDSFRPPLYPALMALVFSTGCGTQEVRALQVVLSVFSTVMVFALVSATGSVGAARVGAALEAFDPVQIGFSHLLWSETLYVFLLLTATYLLLQGQERDRNRYWVLCGMAVGFAGLTRSQILTFLPLILAWLLLGQRRSQRGGFGRIGRQFVLILAGCMLVVLPWTVRNLQTTGTVVAVDTNWAFNLLVGSEPSAYFVDKDDVWDHRWGTIDGVAYRDVAANSAGYAQRRALTDAYRTISSHPLRFARKILWEAGHLWTLDSFLLRHLRNGWYKRPTPQWLSAAVTLGTVGYSVFILGVGLLGVVCYPHRGLRHFILLLLLHATAMAGVAYSLSRYAVPLRPFLSMGAGLLVAGWLGSGPEIRPGSQRRQWIVSAMILLGLLCVWLRDLPLLHDMVANGGKAHLFLLLGR